MVVNSSKEAMRNILRYFEEELTERETTDI